MYTIVIYLSIQGVPLGFCPKAVFGVGVGEKYIGVPYAYQGQPYVVGGGMRKEAYKAGLCIFYCAALKPRALHGNGRAVITT